MTDPGADRGTDPGAEPGTQTTQAQIRRAPRVAVFLILGAILGAVVALVLTAAGHVSPRVGFGATWGYFCLLCIPIGIAVGAVVAIVLDQISRRRSRLVTVEHARVDVAPDSDDKPAG